MSTPVSVNLNVNADAQGTINVFTQAPTVPETNIIEATVTLPASALYNSPGNGLLRFKGEMDAIEGELDPGFTTTEAAIAASIHTVLTSPLDAANALPYSLAKYDTDESYRLYDTFGHVALANYTDYIFGHVAATAAIDNDTVFIERMNGFEGEADAQLAIKLAQDIKNLSALNCQSVVEQVLGQDPSRAMNVDNEGEDWQTLRFKNGDIIYFDITLLAPTINIANLPGLPNVADYTNITYHIKVYLSGPEDPPAPDTSELIDITSIGVSTGNITYNASEARTAYLRIKEYGTTTNYSETTFTTNTTNGSVINYVNLLAIELITQSVLSEITIIDAATNLPISNTLTMTNPTTIGGLTISGPINFAEGGGGINFTATADCIDLIFIITNSNGADTYFLPPVGRLKVFSGESITDYFGDAMYTPGVPSYNLSNYIGQTLSIGFLYNRYDRASNPIIIQ